MGTALPRLVGSTLGVLMLAVSAVGCSRDSGLNNGGPTTVAKPAPAVADLDTYRSEDMKFYDSLRFEGALLARPPADVRVATERATVVVVARIRDVVPQRVIGDLQTAGIQLDVVDILHGQLRPELVGKVVVEFPIGDPGDASQQITSLHAALPAGEAVWFLRWQGDKNPITKPGVSANSDPADPGLYGLLHMHAMFVQGPDTVVNPLGEHDNAASRSLPGIQADGESFAKLSQLADHIRTLR